MAVIPDFKATTLTAFIQQNVAPGSTIYTDGLEDLHRLGGSGIQAHPALAAARESICARGPSRWSLWPTARSGTSSNG